VLHRHALVASWLLLLGLLGGIAPAYAACGAGTVLFAQKDGQTWLLLADHLHWFQRDRGWAAFGGLCDGEAPEVAAARETEEETRGFYPRERILEGIGEAEHLRTGDYYTWFVEVPYVPAARITAHVPPDQSGNYFERGPFAWVPLAEIWSAIDELYPGRVWLPSDELPPRRNTSWLFRAFVENLLTARNKDLLPPR
jgi:8-oxo-dGTP pyrophosphatase MutT (NUDIX family)